jgi:hypothetical protein
MALICRPHGVGADDDHRRLNGVDPNLDVEL